MKKELPPNPVSPLSFIVIYVGVVLWSVFAPALSKPSPEPEPACKIQGEWDVTDWDGKSGSMAFATSGKYLAYGRWGEWTGTWSVANNVLAVEETSGSITLQWSVAIAPTAADRLSGTLGFPGGKLSSFKATRKKP